jgi:hypothetical protein
MPDCCLRPAPDRHDDPRGVVSIRLTDGTYLVSATPGTDPLVLAFVTEYAPELHSADSDVVMMPSQRRRRGE